MTQIKSSEKKSRQGECRQLDLTSRRRRLAAGLLTGALLLTGGMVQSAPTVVEATNATAVNTGFSYALAEKIGLAPSWGLLLIFK